MLKKNESNLSNYLSDKLTVVLTLASIVALITSTAVSIIIIRASSSSDFISQYRPYLGINKAFKKDDSFAMYGLVLLGAVYCLLVLSLAYRYHSRRRDVAIFSLSTSIFVLILTILVIQALLRIS